MNRPFSFGRNKGSGMDVSLQIVVAKHLDLLHVTQSVSLHFVLSREIYP